MRLLFNNDTRHYGVGRQEVSQMYTATVLNTLSFQLLLSNPVLPSFHFSSPPSPIFLCIKAVFTILSKLTQFHLLKKIVLDKDNPSNCIPISNLNNKSTLHERLILICIQDHTISSTNFDPLQSAYRRFHSTETALLLTLDRISTLLTKAHPQSSSPSISVPHLAWLITRYSSTDSTLHMVFMM